MKGRDICKVLSNLYAHTHTYMLYTHTVNMLQIYTKLENYSLVNLNEEYTDVYCASFS